jgi:hypothetical protein
MKKLICFTLAFLTLWLFTLRADAPPFVKLIVPEGTPVYIFNLKDPFARAVAFKESSFDPLIVNKRSGARGLMQITPVMIREVNKICKKLNLPNRYIWKDAFDPYKSIEIWYIVQGYKNPEYYYDKACRIWFGVGKQHDGKTWEWYYTEVMGVVSDYELRE